MFTFNKDNWVVIFNQSLMLGNPFDVTNTVIWAFSFIIIYHFCELHSVLISLITV